MGSEREPIQPEIYNSPEYWRTAYHRLREKIVKEEDKNCARADKEKYSRLEKKLRIWKEQEMQMLKKEKKQLLSLAEKAKTSYIQLAAKKEEAHTATNQLELERKKLDEAQSSFNEMARVDKEKLRTWKEQEMQKLKEEKTQLLSLAEKTKASYIQLVAKKEELWAASNQLELERKKFRKEKRKFLAEMCKGKGQRATFLKEKETQVEEAEAIGQRKLNEEGQQVQTKCKRKGRIDGTYDEYRSGSSGEERREVQKVQTGPFTGWNGTHNIFEATDETEEPNRCKRLRNDLSIGKANGEMIKCGQDAQTSERIDDKEDLKCKFLSKEGGDQMMSDQIKLLSSKREITVNLEENVMISQPISMETMQPSTGGIPELIEKHSFPYSGLVEMNVNHGVADVENRNEDTDKEAKSIPDVPELGRKDINLEIRLGPLQFDNNTEVSELGRKGVNLELLLGNSENYLLEEYGSARTRGFSASFLEGRRSGEKWKGPNIGGENKNEVSLNHTEIYPPLFDNILKKEKKIEVDIENSINLTLGYSRLDVGVFDMEKEDAIEGERAKESEIIEQPRLFVFGI